MPLDERDVQERGHGPVGDPGEDLLRLLVDRHEAGAAAVETEDASEGPANGKERAGRQPAWLGPEGFDPAGEWNPRR